MKRALAFCAALAMSSAAHSHDFWANGEPVPPWVKAYCCGPEDVHHIKASSVHIRADGYHIDGLDIVIPIDKALPSVDGQFWGFWSPINEPHPLVYCFFAPLNGV